MMKKLFPTLILAASISTVHAEPVNEAQLIGRWQCTTEYPQREVTITTNDTLTLHPNHRADDNGTYHIRLEDINFRYQQPSSGTWQLERNMLTFIWHDGLLTPHHDAATRQAIRHDPALRRADRAFARILGQSSQPVTIILRIDSLDASTMRQTQIDDQTGQEMAQSICRRLPN